MDLVSIGDFGNLGAKVPGIRSKEEHRDNGDDQPKDLNRRNTSCCDIVVLMIVLPF